MRYHIQRGNERNIYNNISRFYYEIKKFKESYNYIKKAVEIWSKVLPSNHRDLINANEGLRMIEKKL